MTGACDPLGKPAILADLLTSMWLPWGLMYDTGIGSS